MGSYLFPPVPAGVNGPQNPQLQTQRLIAALQAQRQAATAQPVGLRPDANQWTGYAQGGEMQGGGGGDDEHLNNMLDEVYSAMSGQHPDSEGAAMDYAHYLLPGSMDDYQHSGQYPGMDGGDGNGAPHEGLVQGEDGGMDDSVSAQSDDGSPVKLSHGEYVIPADVVAMLGDGNTDAGAKRLEQFIEQFRQSKYGNGGEQPEQTPEDVFNLLSGPEGAAAPQGGPPAGSPGAAPPEEGSPEEEAAESPEEEQQEQPEEEEPEPQRRGGKVR